MESTLAAAFCRNRVLAPLADADALALEHDDVVAVPALERLHFLDAAALATLLRVRRWGAARHTEARNHGLHASRTGDSQSMVRPCFDPWHPQPSPFVDSATAEAARQIRLVVRKRFRFAIDEPSFQRREFEEPSNLRITTPGSS